MLVCAGAAGLRSGNENSDCQLPRVHAVQKHIPPEIDRICARTREWNDDQRDILGNRVENATIVRAVTPLWNFCKPNALALIVATGNPGDED